MPHRRREVTVEAPAGPGLLERLTQGGRIWEGLYPDAGIVSGSAGSRGVERRLLVSECLDAAD